MHIKLICPRFSLRPMDTELKRVMAPSLAMLTIAALTPNCHRVTIEDENVAPLFLDDQPDLVGITVNVDTSYRAYEIAQDYRHRGIPVILGGLHPSSLPDEALNFADSVCIGEAEPVWCEILQDTELCSLNIKWNAAVSANIILFPKLLDLFRESGCQSLFIGFETIDQYAIKNSGKQQNKVEQYEILIGEIHTREMMINASLVFGFDSHTPDIFPATLDWLVKNRIETMTAHILTPYPGTRMFKRLDRDHRIIDKDWSHYNTAHVVFKPVSMSANELEQGYLWMYDQFYSLKNILRRFPKKSRQLLPFLLFNLGYRKLGRLSVLLGRICSMKTVGRIGSSLAYGLE